MAGYICHHRYPRITVPGQLDDSQDAAATACLADTRTGDEWLLNVAMHYRWNVFEDELQDLFVDFGKMVLPWGPRVLHHKLGRSLASRFKKFVPRLGVTTETIPELELWYEKFLVDLETHFSTHDYLLGAHPTIADFGFIGSGLLRNELICMRRHQTQNYFEFFAIGTQPRSHYRRYGRVK